MRFSLLSEPKASEAKGSARKGRRPSARGIHRIGAGLSALTLLAVTGSCGVEDKSGACTGTMNGAYFRLEFANYLIDTSVDVRINGRFVATIGRADTAIGSTDIEPKVRRLGEFPVCDKMVIDAKGNNGSYSSKICSKPAYLSPSCSGGSFDFCYETILLVPSTECTDPGGGCLPFTPGSPACPCPTGLEPGTAWEPC